MAILGCSMDEVEGFIAETNKLRNKLIDDSEYRNRVLLQKKDYIFIKDYFENFVRFLKYKKKITIDSFYRVRKAEDSCPFTSRKEVIYPEPSLKHEDRMNNQSSRVLYVSLHEFTAMAETRIDHSFIKKQFQLTRFSTDKELNVFELGLFSELHFKSPRDSLYVKNWIKELLGSGNHDRTVRGYAALECAMADILYDQQNGYHILSSILADVIFAMNSDIDAILYPSMQNRYGTNLAINKEFADTLSVTYTSFNRLTDVYQNGFYKYLTLKECLDCRDPELFEFKDTGRQSCYR